MRILFILRHFPPEKSGMATQMFNTVRFLKRRGVNVFVTSLNVRGEKKEGGVKSGFFMDEILKNIRNKYRPDIVHFDSVWPAGPAIVRVFKTEKKS